METPLYYMNIDSVQSALAKSCALAGLFFNFFQLAGLNVCSDPLSWARYHNTDRLIR